MAKIGSIEWITDGLRRGGRMWSSRGTSSAWIHSFVTVDDFDRERTVLLDDRDVRRAVEAKAVRAVSGFGPERLVEYLLAPQTRTQ